MSDYQIQTPDYRVLALELAVKATKEVGPSGHATRQLLKCADDFYEWLLDEDSES